MGGKGKFPKSAYTPTPRKDVRPGFELDVASMAFRWSLEGFDWSGPYSVAHMGAEELVGTIISHLQAFETMTWGEIEGPTGSHFVALTDLEKAARKRLPQINMQDVDQIFSLRCGGKPRIWGVRDIAVLRVLWWDPDHLICPSQKKHT